MMKRIDYWHARNTMQTAIIDGEESVTYQELDERVQERAKILAGIPQKVILAPMSNALDQLINFLALIRANKVAVPVNAGHSDQGLQDILNEFEAPLVLSDIHTISQKAAMPVDSAEYASTSDLAEYCEQIEPPVRMIEPASAINRATQCKRESH